MKNEKHTPGAMRAAIGHLRRRGKVTRNPAEECPEVRSLAARIDRETASPDLLAALKRALVALDNMEPMLRNGYVHAPHYEEARAAARAAIAKAEGGE